MFIVRAFRRHRHGPAEIPEGKPAAFFARRIRQHIKRIGDRFGRPFGAHRPAETGGNWRILLQKLCPEVQTGSGNCGKCGNC